MKKNNFKNNFIDENFFRPKWYSIFFSPYFIIRYGLYKEIKKIAAQVNGDEKILDVGCGLKPYRSLFFNNEYTGIDIQGGGHIDGNKIVDAYYDGLNIPYNNNEFDLIICTEVLEHVPDYEGLIKEMFRVLKKGGKLYLTTPFVWNEHETPYDFRRFTSYEHRRLLKSNNFIVESITPISGIFGVLGQLFCAFIFESIKFRNSLVKLLLTLIIFMPIQVVSIFLDKILGKRWITLGYAVVAKKNNYIEKD